MKMWKRGMKLISFVLIMIMIMILMTTSAFATGGPSEQKLEQVKTNVAASNSSSGPTEASVQIQQRGTKILNAFVWFGYAIALGMVVFIGIKYMLGAADARASMKSAIVGWLIGALIVFMATTIVGWVLSASGVKEGESADGLANQIVDQAKELTK